MPSVGKSDRESCQPWLQPHLTVSGSQSIAWGIQWTPGALREAARTGKWSIVRWLLPRIGEAGRDTILVREAFKQNNLPALKWAISKQFPVMNFNFDPCSDEEWPRRKEIFSFLVEDSIEPARIILAFAIEQAVQAGDIDFLVTLLANSECQRGGPGEAMISAAKSGRLENEIYDLPEYVDEEYEMASEEDFFTPSTAIDAAARNGHLEVLQYLQNLDPEAAEYPRCSTVAMDAAAARGHLEVLKWLHAHRSEGCTTLAMDRAASRRFHVPSCDGSAIGDTCCLDKAPSEFYENQLAIVQWLHQNRSEGCTTAAMDGAAANGDFVMLQWLHSNTTAACSHKAMDGAARVGRLDIVQWLHSNRSEGCSTAAMDNAAANGHLEVVVWLSGNRSEGCTGYAIEAAANFGHRAVIEWLYAHRPEVSEVPAVSALLAAVSHGNVELVQWLLSNCSGTHMVSAMTMALQVGNFEMGLFLHAHLTEDCNDDDLASIQTLIHSGSLQPMVSAWLDENFSIPEHWNGLID